MSSQSLNPPSDTGSCFSKLSLSSETVDDVGSSIVSPPKLADPKKASRVPQSPNDTGGNTSTGKTTQGPTTSAGKQAFSKPSPNRCRGKWCWIILLIVVIFVLIAVGVIVYAVTRSKSTTVILAAARRASTSGFVGVPTKRVSTTITTSKPSSLKPASSHASTTTQAPISTFCNTLYVMNKQCGQTKITLRPDTEALFVLSGVFNVHRECSGTFEINADSPDRVVLWTPLVYYFHEICQCPRNPQKGCPESIITRFKINGKDSTSDECSKATSVGDTVTVQFNFTRLIPNPTVVFYRAIEAIKLKGDSASCSSHKPFGKPCKISEDAQTYCIHPDVPCLDGKMCKYTNEGHASCGGAGEQVEFLIRKGTEELQYGGGINVTYILPGNNMTLRMKGTDNSNRQEIWSFRSADNRMKLSVQSTRKHPETGCRVECATGKVKPESHRNCANAAFVEAADTVVGAKDTTRKLLCDPVRSEGDTQKVYNRTTVMLGSSVKLSAFKQSYSNSEATISVSPICGGHCSVFMRTDKDCFGNY